jgi:hypothetical protein
MLPVPLAKALSPLLLQPLPLPLPRLLGRVRLPPRLLVLLLPTQSQLAQAVLLQLRPALPQLLPLPQERPRLMQPLLALLLHRQWRPACRLPRPPRRAHLRLRLLRLM